MSQPVAQTLFHQEAAAPDTSSFHCEEPPIDPQLTNHAYLNQLPYGQHKQDQQLYFEPHTEMDLDLEAQALHQLLNTTSPTYEEGSRGISDRELEMMLTKQLEEEVSTSGATMEIDSAERYHERYL